MSQGLEGPVETKEEEISVLKMADVPPQLESSVEYTEHIPVSMTPEYDGLVGTTEEGALNSKRSRKPSEKGELYQKELLNSRLKKSKKAVEKQLEVIESLLTTSESMDVLSSEDETLDRKFNDLLEILSRLRDQTISDEERCNLSADVETIDAKIFAMKRRISHVAMRQVPNQPKRTSVSGGSCKESLVRDSVRSKRAGSSHSSTRSSVRQKDLIASLEAKHEAMKKTLEAEALSDAIKAEIEADIAMKSNLISGGSHMESLASHESGRSKVSGSSHSSTRSSVRQKALIAGLEAKREAMRETQEAEAQADTIKAEVEVEMAKRLKVAQQKTELLKIEEQIAKAKAMKQVYKEKEGSKLGPGTGEDCLSRSSRGSHTSRVSKRSSVAQEALIAGLKAESEAKRKTQEAEIQVERIKSEAAALMARKLKETKQKVKMLKLEEQISEAKAIESVHRENKSEPGWRDSIDGFSAADEIKGGIDAELKSKSNEPLRA